GFGVDPDCAAVAAAVRGLERLEQLVALGLVEREVVGDEDPVGPLELLEVEDLGVERRRVVDNDHHLGLRVEIRARADDQLVELVVAIGCHARIYSRNRAAANPGPRHPPSSRSWRSTSASTSSGSLPWRTRRACRAITSWRTSSRSSASAGAAAACVSFAISASTSSGDSPRATRRFDFASTSWRISSP